MYTFLFMLISYIFFFIFLHLLIIGKVTLFELTALVLILIGGNLMVLMGKTLMGYIGIGLFSVGSLLKIIDTIKKPSTGNK